jgi:hypothetical protein
VSESQPESGPGALVAALNVPTHARRGFVVAALLTAAVFAFFVVIPGAERSMALYAGLAFVLFVSLGGFVTAVFVAGSAISQIRDL